jgi:hypothetical protein
MYLNSILERCWLNHSRWESSPMHAILASRSESTYQDLSITRTLCSHKSRDDWFLISRADSNISVERSMTSLNSMFWSRCDSIESHIPHFYWVNYKWSHETFEIWCWSWSLSCCQICRRCFFLLRVLIQRSHRLVFESSPQWSHREYSCQQFAWLLCMHSLVHLSVLLEICLWMISLLFTLLCEQTYKCMNILYTDELDHRYIFVHETFHLGFFLDFYCCLGLFLLTDLAFLIDRLGFDLEVLSKSTCLLNETRESIWYAFLYALIVLKNSIFLSATICTIFQLSQKFDVYLRLVFENSNTNIVSLSNDSIIFKSIISCLRFFHSSIHFFILVFAEIIFKFRHLSCNYSLILSSKNLYLVANVRIISRNKDDCLLNKI